MTSATINYGGITFKHIWDFQIKIMMGSQYRRCVEATEQNEIIVACLRLGWNDAFRHTSENIKNIKDNEKEDIIIGICKNLVEDFKKYAMLKTTEDRKNCISGLFSASSTFADKFKTIKVTDSVQSDKALCFGHIQKMFNIAMKLFLCLKICTEQASAMGINIGLDKALFTCNFAFETADCPIDSIILNRIDQKMEEGKIAVELPDGHQKYRDIVWSKLGSKSKGEPISNYEKAQNAIAELQKGTGKSNLCFDFENWNS